MLNRKKSISMPASVAAARCKMLHSGLGIVYNSIISLLMRALAERLPALFFDIK
jgi:hypothetical protein